MRSQRLEGGRIEGEGASAAGRLGVGLVHLVVDGHPGQARRQPGPREVNAAPPQTREFGRRIPVVATRIQSAYSRSSRTDDNVSRARDDVGLRVHLPE